MCLTGRRDDKATKLKRCVAYLQLYSTHSNRIKRIEGLYEYTSRREYIPYIFSLLFRTTQARLKSMLLFTQNMVQILCDAAGQFKIASCASMGY